MGLENEGLENEGPGTRTVRKPGHAWQENELYDVYLPIIGRDATLVWSTMTRVSYGAEVDASLRELAELACMSKDSVSRALQVLLHLGMVRTRGRGPRACGRYLLADLKLLTIDLGGVFVRQRAAYALPEDVSGRLREQVATLLRSAQRKRSKTASVAQSDSAADARSDRSVALSGASVAPAGHALDNKTQNNKTTIPTPTPSPREGDLAEQTEVAVEDEQVLRFAQDDKPCGAQDDKSCGAQDDKPCGAQDDKRDDRRAAVEQAMRGCGMVRDRRMERVLLAVLVQQMEAGAGAAGEIAERMIAAWLEYQQLGTLRAYVWGPVKFFRQGHWLQPESWPLDLEELRRQQGARVGCWR
ncbi:MAG TPA: hypothetical protein VM554_13000 [Acidisarcina sp.]|nr:hypothetical protein [Acidisarcina sp.]